MKEIKTMVIGGIDYEVVGEKAFCNLPRVEIALRRPKGKRVYHAVRYEDGSLSEVI